MTGDQGGALTPSGGLHNVQACGGKPLSPLGPYGTLTAAFALISAHDRILGPHNRRFRTDGR